MCVTLILAAVATVAAATGAVASIGAANANKQNAKYTAAVEQKQLNEQRNTARLQALRQEVGRTNEFAQTRSAALASIGASGLGESVSFAQGIDPAGAKALGQDVQAIRLNLVGQEASISDRVGVSEYGAKIASFNSGMAKIGAVADFAKSAMSAADFYTTNTPGKKAA